MKRSQRGAARISAVWMVAVIVAFFIAVGVAFIAFDQGRNFEEQKNEAAAKLQVAEARVETEREAMRSLSELVGYYDASTGASRSEVEGVRAGLTSLREAFPDMDPSIKNLQQASGVVIASYKARGDRIKALESERDGLRAELDSKGKALNDLTASKDRELAQLRSDLSDADQAKNDQQANLEKRVAAVQADLTDRDTKYRTAQGTIDEAARNLEREQETWRTRFSEMSNKLKFIDEPQAPDAQVLAVSKDLALGWIDIGAHQRLARGMRFHTVSGDIGSERVKAWAEVTRVDPDMAEVRFYGQTDPFDPPNIGDVLYNPLYDPHGERNAVLAGRFSGIYNEKELKALLEQIGINVQDKLDLTTDYLIVGSEIYVDPDTQEPLEEPLQPSDLPVYKDAVANGLAIVPIKDVRQYFKN